MVRWRLDVRTYKYLGGDERGWMGRWVGRLCTYMEARGGEEGEQVPFGRVEARTCSFIRFLRAPVPTLIILLANSTPMVCEDKTRHSFLTKRCNMQDLWRRKESSAERSRFAPRRHRPATVG